jgi:hypothetical protein
MRTISHVSGGLRAADRRFMASFELKARGAPPAVRSHSKRLASNARHSSAQIAERAFAEERNRT